MKLARDSPALLILPQQQTGRQSTNPLGLSKVFLARQLRPYVEGHKGSRGPDGPESKQPVGKRIGNVSYPLLREQEAWLAGIGAQT